MQGAGPAGRCMPEPSLAAIVLAAGASRRLGQPKQLVEIEGESLLRRTARLAVEAGCSPVVVVLGFAAERLRGEVAGMQVQTVVHEGWEEGMGSSLRCGMAALSARRTAGVLLLVCDQPRLDAAHLRRLLMVHAGGRDPITASVYGGQAGVPAVFSAAMFPELLQVAGDRGAREILRRYAGKRQEVPWPEGEQDLDLPEDLKELDAP